MEARQKLRVVLLGDFRVGKTSLLVANSTSSSLTDGYVPAGK